MFGSRRFRRSVFPGGVSNSLSALSLAAAIALTLLIFLLYRGAKPPQSPDRTSLLMYCAAGARYPVDEIVREYEQRYGVKVEVQYGGSNSLLNQLEVARVGDLYLAGDETFMRLASNRQLVAEVLPLALQTPVIVVRRGNPRKIRGLDDLLRDDVTVVLGTPEGPAIGAMTRELLTASGHWDRLAAKVTQRGVFKPTVNDIANDVKLGSVEAGIVWDATATQYPELETVHDAALDRGTSRVEIGVLTSTRHARAAIRCARYFAARNAGLEAFAKHAFQVVDGDVWEEQPEITFFAGSVNRRVLEPIVTEFEQREGIRVNTVYNGCGILTAQMRASLDNPGSAFPDTYMACDVYYLETVKDLFQEAVDVSDTDIVIAVQKGNPKSIRSLRDLLQPGLRVAVGQPEQCTIGVLTRRLLEKEGIYDQLLREHVVTQTATSALLVPSVTTGAADAALAYATDTLGEPDRIEVIRVESQLAKAVQPFSIARSSDHKHTGRRLFEHIARSRAVFERNGFHWRLDALDPPQADTNPAEKP
jgi:molybdenum ABC transporter molybdate-binding protein